MSDNNAPVDEALDMVLVEMAEACIAGNLRATADAVRKAHARLFAALAEVRAARDAWQRRYRERCGQDLGDVGAAINEAGRASGEAERLRGVIREAVGKLTNLHCKTKRDQSRLCMAFDALYPEAQR